MNNRTRRYAETKRVNTLTNRWLQEDFVRFTAERLKQRYRRQTKFQVISLGDWLLEKRLFEATFSGQFSSETRRFWATRVADEAMALTHGAFADLTWFFDALQAELGVDVVIDLDIITVGKYAEKHTFVFRAPLSVEHETL